MQGDSRTAGESTPLGRPRRPRLSDQETQRRMLTTAADAVTRTGLTVSLDHIRLEDVIREAGVARSAVYRKWPSKDDFLADLLLELARAQQPMQMTGAADSSAEVRAVVGDHLEDLETAEGRQRALVDVVRRATERDFRHISTSPQWQTYLTLTVTFAGLPEGELRAEVQAALAASEQSFTQRIAGSHRTVVELLGMRPRTADVGYDVIADLTNALVRGLIGKAQAVPELAERRVETEVAGVEGSWSLAALGMVGIVLAHVEPDPDLDWEGVGRPRLEAALAGDDLLFEADGGE